MLEVRGMMLEVRGVKFEVRGIRMFEVRLRGMV